MMVGENSIRIPLGEYEEKFKQRIYEMWRAGSSAGVIARVLNQEFPVAQGKVTRNVVIGRVQRAPASAGLISRATSTHMSRNAKIKPIGEVVTVEDREAAKAKKALERKEKEEKKAEESKSKALTSRGVNTTSYPAGLGEPVQGLKGILEIGKNECRNPIGVSDLVVGRTVFCGNPTTTTYCGKCKTYMADVVKPKPSPGPNPKWFR